MSCPGYVSESWRSYTLYTLYAYKEMDNSVLPRRYNNVENDKYNVYITQDIDCLHALHLTYHELQLFMVGIATGRGRTTLSTGVFITTLPVSVSIRIKYVVMEQM